MHSYNLSKFLSGHVFAYLLLLCRIGGVFMLFPGIAETYVPPRSRMALAMAISFVLLEPLLPRMPAMPQGTAELVRLVSYEVFIGLFFGTFLRLLISALETAGAIISLQTGLSNATVLNPALASQSPLASAFLSVAGVTLIFITGLDHYLLQGMVALYDQFPPGQEVLVGDTTQVIIQAFNRSFVVGVELGLPFIVLGLLLFSAIGMMQKLMPQVQLFLVVLPVQIWGGMALVTITISGIMTVWLHYFDSSVGAFFGRS